MLLRIDVSPQAGRDDSYNVDPIVPRYRFFPHIQSVSSPDIDNRLGQIGWSLLRERFAAQRRLRGEEIEAGPEELIALGFSSEQIGSFGGVV
jgi:hypothetical protein